MNRTVVVYVIGPVIAAMIIFAVLRMFNLTHARTITTDVVQGIFAGAGLSFITVLLVLPTFFVEKVHGWTTMRGCGDPNSTLVRRVACNVIFMGPINIAQEAMYWTTSKDGAGHALSGAHKYVLHFALGQLPPNNAFWSLTMGDAGNHFVPNPLNRYSLSDRSGLAQNADGSVDIYIQNTAPAGHESNWLPAPTGRFILWLRVYLPAQSILNGEYQVPPVTLVS